MSSAQTHLTGACQAAAFNCMCVVISGQINCDPGPMEEIATCKPNMHLRCRGWKLLEFVNLRGDARLARATENFELARYFGLPPKCRSQELDDLAGQAYGKASFTDFVDCVL